MCFMHTLQWPMNLSYFLTTNILRTQVHDTHEQYNHYYIVHSCSGAIHNRHIHTLNIQGEMYVNGGHHAMIHDLFCLHSGSQPQYFHMQFMYAWKGAQFRQALDLTHDEIFGFSMDLMFGGCVCVCASTQTASQSTTKTLWTETKCCSLISLWLCSSLVMFLLLWGIFWVYPSIFLFVHSLSAPRQCERGRMSTFCSFHPERIK